MGVYDGRSNKQTGGDEDRSMSIYDDYIKRSDAITAMAQYLMNIARIEKPEASDRIEEWESNVVAPIMSTVEAADVRENITAHKVIGGGEHDGVTCWFECSRCGKTVDVNDKYCSECGARFEA